MPSATNTPHTEQLNQEHLAVKFQAQIQLISDWIVFRGGLSYPIRLVSGSVI